jgi:hypothetical protein
MAHKLWVVAFGVIVAASPLSAASVGPASAPAPTDSADARYCLRVEASTGTLIETVLCWTRAEWAEQGVDVDKDWATEGVAIINDGAAVPSRV